MEDIQYGIKEEMAQDIISAMSETVDGALSDAQLADIQNDLLEALLKDFVVKPTRYDYDDLSIDEVRNGLFFLEKGILDSPLNFILPEAMTEAIAEVLTEVLAAREIALLSKEK